MKSIFLPLRPLPLILLYFCFFTNNRHKYHNHRGIFHEKAIKDMKKYQAYKERLNLEREMGLIFGLKG
jgi:hypothetical protein